MDYMSKYTYPVVFVSCDETGELSGYMPDLAIFAEGTNPEDVYAEMEEILKNYVSLATKYNAEIPTPSSLDDIAKKWVGYKTSLITAKI